MQLKGSGHQAGQPARTIHAVPRLILELFSRATESQEKHELQVVDGAANLPCQLWQLCCWDLGFPVCTVGAFAWDLRPVWVIDDGSFPRDGAAQGHGLPS